MARAKIIVTPKKKAKKDRELKKQLKELEKFKPKELTAEKPKRLVKDVDYIPTVDIFDMIEDAIFYKIPNETMIWRKGHKGGIPVDLTSLKQQAIFIIKDFASSDDKDVANYFRENEGAIMETISGFTYSSTSSEFATLTERFLNLINMQQALSADAMYYNEVSEMLDLY